MNSSKRLSSPTRETRTAKATWAWTMTRNVRTRWEFVLRKRYARISTVTSKRDNSPWLWSLAGGWRSLPTSLLSQPCAMQITASMWDVG